jgi:2,3-dihydroxybenzoate-AMP ligase
MATPIAQGTVGWPEEFVRRYVDAGYWAGHPLGAEFAAAVDRDPDAVALVDGDLRISYRELLERADGAAVRMAERGIRRGDRIVVQLANGWPFVVLTLACLRSGVVPVMALPGHRRTELSYLVEHAEAVAIAVPDVLRDFDHQALAEELAAGSSTLRHVLVDGDTEHVDLRALGEPGGGWDGPAPDPRDVAVFLLSGGTTGLPKLIARTHDDYAYNARASAELCGFDADTVYLVSLPAGHNFPLACPGILGTLLTGGRVVMLGSPEPRRAFATIEAEGVTATAVVPAVAGRWLEHAAEHGRPGDSLRLLQVGGARLADELAVRVRPVLGAQLQQVFGMAEGLLNYTRLDDRDDVVCRTQGRPLSPADEVRLVDEQDRDVPDGQPGSLLTRGPYTPRGYYRAPEQNARAFTPDGWYRSGDICRRTAEGNLVVEGRDKDMINRGGEKISAEEVENLVYALPEVSQVAAVAMPDRVLGERVCVFVVARPGTTVTLDEVRAGMDAVGVAAFKLPERLVLVDELPLTKVGKIDKKALRAALAGEVAMDRRDPEQTLPVMGAGTEFVLRLVGALPDDALREPSALPGWTRAHVVAHLARNAEALTRLATWARTGVETPMYPSREARAADIERSAQASDRTLRDELVATAEDLDAAFAALDGTTWHNTVRSALGRPLPAVEVPWMRIREVWLHAVDLDAGAGLSDLPPEVVDALLDDATGTLSAKDSCPAAVLRPTDREGTWSLGPTADAVELTGTAADLLGWLIGRTDGDGVTASDGKVPVPPPWL